MEQPIAAAPIFETLKLLWRLNSHEVVENSKSHSHPHTTTTPMKTTLLSLALVLVGLASTTANAQSVSRGQNATTSPKPRPEGMQLIGTKIYLGGVPMAASDAYFVALDKDMVAAQMFKRAAKIRGWNYFWFIYGGLNAGTGLVELADGYDANNFSGIVNTGVGGGLIALGVSREKRRTRLVATAVQRYNKAVLSEEEPD
jgi:hypothetical protein